MQCIQQTERANDECVHTSSYLSYLSVPPPQYLETCVYRVFKTKWSKAATKTGSFQSTSTLLPKHRRKTINNLKANTGSVASQPSGANGIHSNRGVIGGGGGGGRNIAMQLRDHSPSRRTCCLHGARRSRTTDKLEIKAVACVLPQLQPLRRRERSTVCGPYVSVVLPQHHKLSPLPLLHKHCAFPDNPNTSNGSSSPELAKCQKEVQPTPLSEGDTYTQTRTRTFRNACVHFFQCYRLTSVHWSTGKRGRCC